MKRANTAQGVGRKSVSPAHHTAKSARLSCRHWLPSKEQFANKSRLKSVIMRYCMVDQTGKSHLFALRADDQC